TQHRGLVQRGVHHLRPPYSFDTSTRPTHPSVRTPSQPWHLHDGCPPPDAPTHRQNAHPTVAASSPHGHGPRSGYVQPAGVRISRVLMGAIVGEECDSPIRSVLVLPSGLSCSDRVQLGPTGTAGPP